MDDKFNANTRDTTQRNDAVIVARQEYDAMAHVVGKEDGDVHQDGSLLADYTKGFPENHHATWTVMRVALMAIGIPIGCRRSRRIRCHGHGGACGHYSQEKPCRPSSVRSGCCKSKKATQTL